MLPPHNFSLDTICLAEINKTLIHICKVFKLMSKFLLMPCLNILCVEE